MWSPARAPMAEEHEAYDTPTPGNDFQDVSTPSETQVKPSAARADAVGTDSRQHLSPPLDPPRTPGWQTQPEPGAASRSHTSSGTYASHPHYQDDVDSESTATGDTDSVLSPESRCEFPAAPVYIPTRPRFYVTEPAFEDFHEVSAEAAAFLAKNSPDTLLVKVLGVFDVSRECFGGIEGSALDNDYRGGARRQWRKLLEIETGQSLGRCTAYKFRNSATVGGHACFQRFGNRWFIVPLCYKHTARSFEGDCTMRAQPGSLAVEIAPLCPSMVKAFEQSGVFVPRWMKSKSAASPPPLRRLRRWESLL